MSSFVNGTEVALPLCSASFVGDKLAVEAYNEARCKKMWQIWPEFSHFLSFLWVMHGQVTPFGSYDVLVMVFVD